MTVGRLFGVRVALNRYFLLVMALLGLGGLLVEAALLFAIVFLHELGHVLMAQRAGLEVAEVELLPFGGVARIDDLLDYDPIVEVSVALAGPFVNAALIGAWVMCDHFFSLPGEFGRQFLQANAVIGGFNLLPALPLDGGRVLRALLSRRIGYRRATAMAARTGRIAALLLGLWGGFLLLQGWANATLVVIPVFIFFSAGREEVAAAFTFMRHLVHKRSGYKNARCRPCRHITAPEDASLKEVLWEFVPQCHHVVWVVSKDGRLASIAWEADVVDAVFERGIHELIRNVARPI